MSSDMILSKTKLKFVDTDTQDTGALTFNSQSFYANKKVITPHNITVKGIATGATGTFSGNTDLGNVSETSINLKGTNDNVVTLKTADNTTSYTLTFPESLGAVNQFIKNDGSGNLSFSELVGGYGYEHAWNFGTTKQLWSANWGDPWGTNPVKFPVATLFRAGKWSTDNAGALPVFYPYDTNHHNLRLASSSYSKCRAMISWDQGVSSTYWDMRVQLRISAGGNSTSGCGDYIYFFGNDSLQDISFTSTGNPPSGGAPSDSTGILVLWRYNDTSSNTTGRYLQVWENGTLAATPPALNTFLSGNMYHEYRIVRRGNKLYFAKTLPEGTSGYDYDTTFEHTLSGEFTGTRWGIGYRSTDGSGSSDVNIFCFECRAL